jgi:serine/threonine protein kinase
MMSLPKLLCLQSILLHGGNHSTGEQGVGVAFQFGLSQAHGLRASKVTKDGETLAKETKDGETLAKETFPKTNELCTSRSAVVISLKKEHDSTGVSMSTTRKYHVIRRLGSGSFGDVLAVEACEALDTEELAGFHPGDFRRFALKVQKPDNIDMFEREVNAHRRLKHSNIVGFIEDGVVNKELRLPLSFKTETPVIRSGSLYMLMEYANAGSLEDFAQNYYYGKGLKMEAGILREFIRQMQSAIQYMHSRNFLHRDLKPANILVQILPPAGLPDAWDPDFIGGRNPFLRGVSDTDWRNFLRQTCRFRINFLVADLGIARTEEDDKERHRADPQHLPTCTPIYQPPAVYSAVRKNVVCPETKERDIWALGLTTYQLATNAEPFEWQYDHCYRLEIRDSKYVRAMKEDERKERGGIFLHKSFWELKSARENDGSYETRAIVNMDNGLKSVISLMLMFDGKRRATGDSLAENEWVSRENTEEERVANERAVEKVAGDLFGSPEVDMETLKGQCRERQQENREKNQAVETPWTPIIGIQLDLVQSEDYRELYWKRKFKEDLERKRKTIELPNISPLAREIFERLAPGWLLPEAFPTKGKSSD